MENSIILHVGSIEFSMQLGSLQPVGILAVSLDPLIIW